MDVSDSFGMDRCSIWKYEKGRKKICSTLALSYTANEFKHETANECVVLLSSVMNYLKKYEATKMCLSGNGLEIAKRIENVMLDEAAHYYAFAPIFVDKTYRGLIAFYDFVKICGREKFELCIQLSFAEIVGNAIVRNEYITELERVKEILHDKSLAICKVIERMMGYKKEVKL